MHAEQPVIIDPASFGFPARTAGQCTKFIERILMGILGDDELVCFESNFLTSHVNVIATPTATRDVSGIPIGECAADSVMTPVIVPGLAAKRTSDESPGLSDCVVSFCGDFEFGPLSMVNPIQTNTAPPAT